MLDNIKQVEVLKDIRSIRQYKDTKVDKKIIADIIDCARMAPTANNRQPWEFIVITDEDRLKDLSEIVPSGNFLKDVPVAIVVFCSKDTNYFLEDGSAATQNILSAARFHGLGSCWIAGYQGSYYENAEVPLCEGIPCYTPSSYGEEIRKILDAPENLQLVSVVSLGYSDEKPNVDKRSLEEVLHWNKY
ncbi:nitroreductase family protein [Alkaliphilus peptidifermentans]|uniref:Nitroreductase n=1 Tax=Alkaliphilus peptidifermentans DSM 18978 TaxID=1120976 RepID=A0A1G5J2E9_9FIRM|nr:nitroreductase family protein [Alkaliphilus peptidifermentans]SCY82462.1 Nitroreductase [Alkaliphilus peptidifermentans DSM 18978]